MSTLLVCLPWANLAVSAMALAIPLRGEPLLTIPLKLAFVAVALGNGLELLR